MGVFDDEAELQRVKRERETILKGWVEYARAVERNFAVTELPSMLREFWIAACKSGCARLDSPAGPRFWVGRFNDDLLFYTDQYGLLHFGSGTSGPPIHPTQLVSKYPVCFGFDPAHPESMTVEAVAESIREHWTRHLRKYL